MRWPIVNLGSVANSVMGQAPPGSACNKDGLGTVFVKAGEFSDDGPLRREWTTKPLKMAKSTDVLVCVVGATAGKINASIDCAIGRSVAAVRPDRERLDTRYLFRFLQTQTDRLGKRSQGMAQGVITQEMLSNLEVPLPSLDEQRRIAAILDQANELRRKRVEALTRLEDLKRGLLDLFLKSTHQGRRVRLGDVCTRITDGTHQAPKWTEAGIPFIFVSNVRNGQISLDTDKFVSLATYASLTRHAPIEVGDVLYTAVGSYGHSAVVETDTPFLFQRHVAHIKPDRRQIRSAFLASLLESPLLRRQADRVAKGVAQKTVTLADLKKFELLLPSIGEQDEFLRGAQKVSQLKAIQSAQLSHLDTLFASLQHRAFNGELTRSDVRALEPA